jgi:hypothetical protein
MLTAGGQPMDIPAKEEVVLVTGEDANVVATVLNRITYGTSLLRLNMASAEPSSQKMLRCGDPMLGPEKLISDVCTKLGELSGSISGLVIGDLQAINGNIDPDALRRALPVLVKIGRAAGLPILFFETTFGQHALSTHLASTVIEVALAPTTPSTITAHLSSRTRDHLKLPVGIRG